MYLSRLSSQMKFAFLELELYLSKTDGKLSNDEKQLINAHCNEMRIDHNYYQNDMSLEEVFEMIKDASTEEQRIIYFEIVQLVMADNLYHQNEREFMQTLEGVLGMDQNEIQTVFDMVSSYRNLMTQIDSFIFDVEE
jgi:DnaJ-domain-containing protein 1